MIYVDPGDRRADTMNLVFEGLVQRHNATGKFRLIATACGYSEAVLENLVVFYEAGLIEATNEAPASWCTVLTTVSGRYLMKQWRNGPARRVVPVAELRPEPAIQFPRHAAQMLTDAGWTINGIWAESPTKYYVVSISRFGDNGMPVEQVLVLTAGGHTVLNLSDAEAKQMVPMLLAASL